MQAEASPNIAFIKYWGKLPANSDLERNLATNPSLSLTLSKARTRTTVTRQTQAGAATEFFLNGHSASEKDRLKVQTQLKRITDFLRLPEMHFRVESDNNFPAGAGIASSASAFAALTLAALGEILGPDQVQVFLKNRRHDYSALARRGSGSACRSVSGPFMKWEGSAAVTIESPWKLRDTILILSHQHKSVPSSDGHELAQSSPLFPARLEQVPRRMKIVEAAIKAQNIQKLGPILEEEALELHRIVESGERKVEYLLPDTRRILQAVQSLPNRDFFFTLDAGPNVHLISERPLGEEAQKLLKSLDIQADIWEDEAGFGPRLG